MSIVKPVTVQFNALSRGPGDGSGLQGPYQQYQGDLARCLGCGQEIVTGYGRRPTWEHFHGASEKQTPPDVIVDERLGMLDPIV
jgi:hypothetical protein